MGMQGNSNAPILDDDAAMMLCVTLDGERVTIEELSQAQLYRLCKTLTQGKHRAWEEIEPTLVDERCDKATKWYIVLELLRFGVARVERGVLVKKERKQAA